ncbi:MAG: response regulator, partial [Symploca sp. SIO2C1]|nr:response regulator [Symploca sp. SIO2C1]
WDYYIYTTDNQGNRQELFQFGNPYDARVRPWYKAALKEKDLVWSEVFIIHASQNLGITASLPVYDKNRNLLGAWGTNLLDTQINKFLESLEIGKSGQTFIIERSGLLVASSTGEEPFVLGEDGKLKERLPAVASSVPLTRSTAEHLTEHFGNLSKIAESQQLTFKLNGQRQFLQLKPLKDGRGIDWLIVVVVPEADFMEQINANTRTTIGLCIAALVLAIVVGIVTARWVVQPILRLNTSAKALTKGEWEQKVEIKRSDELGELAKSFNRMANQLQESFATLEQRVVERTAELAIAKDKAEVANQAKSSFLANMSHELRSPLNAILGFAQLMTRSQNLSRENQENVGIIARSGEHLLTLINNVLDLSKIEAGRTSKNEKNFDLIRLLNDLEDMFRLKADDKGLQLLFEHTPDVPQYVRTDEVKLRQILINLLNNALKFTEVGGVSVRVGAEGDGEMGRWEDGGDGGAGGDGEVGEDEENKGDTLDTETPRHGDAQTIPNSQFPIPNSQFPIPNSQTTITFEVEDTGPGIAPEELDSLFEAFAQTQTGQQAQEGTGLGLPISRSFVELMGGQMSVSSEVEHGTLFKFDIRVSIVDATKLETKQPTRRVIALEPNQPRYRILIVDDKPLNRQLLIKLLNPLGFELKEAVNGEEAIAIWESWEPQLIWMDMRMPVMDGYKATQQIKSTTKGQATAIIALTASVLEEERAVILSAGCDDFMRKPFREADIFATMHKHIGVRYVYEEQEQSDSLKDKGNQNVLSASAIANLPREWVVNFEQAVLQGDLELGASSIELIRSQNPQLADALQSCLDNFEYDKILMLISTE